MLLFAWKVSLFGIYRSCLGPACHWGREGQADREVAGFVSKTRVWWQERHVQVH